MEGKSKEVIEDKIKDMLNEYIKTNDCKNCTILLDKKDNGRFIVEVIKVNLITEK